MQAIHQATSRCLRQDAGDSAHRQGNSHALLVPAVAGQVDREERSNARLYIRQEKIQPIQAVQRSLRRASHGAAPVARAVQRPNRRMPEVATGRN